MAAFLLPVPARPGPVCFSVEGLPYQDFIARYDRPSTLFYLDPPYWGLESLYGKGLFERADFERLAGLLKGLRGRFIMSMNDVAEVRELFAGFRIEALETTYTIAGGSGAKRTTELIISDRRSVATDT